MTKKEFREKYDGSAVTTYNFDRSIFADMCKEMGINFTKGKTSTVLFIHTNELKGNNKPLNIDEFYQDYKDFMNSQEDILLKLKNPSDAKIVINMYKSIGYNLELCENGYYIYKGAERILFVNNIDLLNPINAVNEISLLSFKDGVKTGREQKVKEFKKLLEL